MQPGTMFKNGCKWHKSESAKISKSHLNAGSPVHSTRHYVTKSTRHQSDWQTTQNYYVISSSYTPQTQLHSSVPSGNNSYLDQFPECFICLQCQLQKATTKNRPLNHNIYYYNECDLRQWTILEFYTLLW